MCWSAAERHVGGRPDGRASMSLSGDGRPALCAGRQLASPPDQRADLPPILARYVAHGCAPRVGAGRSTGVRSSTRSSTARRKASETTGASRRAADAASATPRCGIGSYDPTSSGERSPSTSSNLSSSSLLSSSTSPRPGSSSRFVSVVRCGAPAYRRTVTAPGWRSCRSSQMVSPLWTSLRSRTGSSESASDLAASHQLSHPIDELGLSRPA